MSVTALKNCPHRQQYDVRDEPSPREKIVQEATDRIRCGLADARGEAIPFERGWSGVDVKQVPKVLLYEDEEPARIVQRLLYQKVLSLWFEYFRAALNPNDVYKTGNRMIREIQTSLELDENFQFGGPPADPCVPPDRNLALCSEYHMTKNAITELSENRVLAIVVYEFTYYEPHFAADC